jgi:hypothetical protein
MRRREDYPYANEPESDDSRSWLGPIFWFLVFAFLLWLILSSSEWPL